MRLNHCRLRVCSGQGKRRNDVGPPLAGGWATDHGPLSEPRGGEAGGNGHPPLWGCQGQPSLSGRDPFCLHPKQSRQSVASSLAVRSLLGMGVSKQVVAILPAFVNTGNSRNRREQTPGHSAEPGTQGKPLCFQVGRCAKILQIAYCCSIL